MPDHELNERSEERPEAVSNEDRLTEGGHYEFTHGPASTQERTLRGVLEEFDPEANTYTFRLEDGNTVSLVDHEIDAVRRLDEDA
ncbi:MAG TPA: hypothetical protein VMM14_02680 [Acidimicrobiia bacterium]|nr:hypothetical protein [Acidimicrobiia bacterium]